MARDATHASGSNYDRQGNTETVIGGTLVFDTTTPIVITVFGANIVLTGVPTSDPAVAGALWANSNVLTLSAG